MVLSLLSDRSTETEAGREGRGSQRGSCTRKKGVLLRNTKFGWARKEWMFGFGGGWASDPRLCFRSIYTKIQET